MYYLQNIWKSLKYENWTKYFKKYIPISDGKIIQCSNAASNLIKGALSKREWHGLFLSTGTISGAGGGLALQNDGRYFCTVCSKTIGNLQNAKRHFVEVHQNSNITATCSICNATVKKRSIYMHYKVVHKISASSMKNLVRPWFFDIIIDNSKPEIWKSIEFIEIYVIEIPNLAKTELRTYNAVFDKIVWPQNPLFSLLFDENVKN